MKKINFIIPVLFAIFISSAFSRQITSQEAKTVASNKINLLQKSSIFSIPNNISTLKDESLILAYIFHLYPTGYIVVSSNTSLPPIPAYSFESNFENSNQLNTLSVMLKKDLIRQNKEAIANNHFKNSNEELWNQLLNTTHPQKTDFQQWPEIGNGWIKTNWTQTAPYSNFCPIDPITSQRSYTGCPATAMSQILNFHQSINQTSFNNNDDYYHNYAGRQFNIDNDYATHGFPSFPELNSYLDTLQNHWHNNIVLTNNDKAALNFACGVAASQVFTSEGSGTFSVSQALDAYHRFGCTSALLIGPTDTSLIYHLMQNMKDTLPAHLAIVDSGWTMGHNIVVDGYNTDGYFHVNFGWGGSSNGWYLLPQGLPSNLTYFEGVVVDIMKNSTMEIPDNNIDIQSVSVFPNPCKDVINISSKLASSEKITLKIWDIAGLLHFCEDIYIDKQKTTSINLSGLNLKSGVLIYQISTTKEVFFGKVIKLTEN
ncbi:MAG: C10 family peptidase [Bacteroidota bacterium]